LKPISLALAAVLFAAAVGVSALVSGQAQTPATTPLVLLSSAGRRVLPTTVANNHEMVALDDLAAAFQLSLRDDALAGGMTVTYKGKTIALMPDQAIASVGGRLVSLPAPVIRDGRRWLVSIDFIPRALALIHDARLDFRRASRLVVIGELRVPRLVVRQEVQGNQVRVTFDASPKTSNTIVQEASRLLVRFDADALDTTIPAVAPHGVVGAIRLTDPGNTIAIVLGPRFGSFRASTVSTDAASTRVIVDLLPAGAPSAPAVPGPQPSQPPQAPAAPALPELFAPPSTPGVRTIVIDPGHGGAEEGARGPSGSLEKDLTLGVAGKLKAAIENRLGLRALLTRDGDTAVSLDDRAAFANNNRADLFISLHVNASLRKDVTGAEVFYLSPEGYAQARQEAAATASLPTFGGGSREIDLILWEVAQMQHLTQSAALAAVVEEELRAHVPMSARPVQQAPFRVLVGANMPAILVEMAFLTNAEQEQALSSNEFQNTIAQALFDAIVRFRDAIGRGRPSSSTAPSSRPPGFR
jgi:N-acetylmuramoyl-L-alanine amidase